MHTSLGSVWRHHMAHHFGNAPHHITPTTCGHMRSGPSTKKTGFTRTWVIHADKEHVKSPEVTPNLSQCPRIEILPTLVDPVTKTPAMGRWSRNARPDPAQVRGFTVDPLQPTRTCAAQRPRSSQTNPGPAHPARSGAVRTGLDGHPGSVARRPPIPRRAPRPRPTHKRVKADADFPFGPPGPPQTSQPSTSPRKTPVRVAPGFRVRSHQRQGTGHRVLRRLPALRHPSAGRRRPMPQEARPRRTRAGEVLRRPDRAAQERRAPFRPQRMTRSPPPASKPAGPSGPP